MMWVGLGARAGTQAGGWRVDGSAGESLLVDEPPHLTPRQPRYQPHVIQVRCCDATAVDLRCPRGTVPGRVCTRPDFRRFLYYRSVSHNTIRKT